MKYAMDRIVKLALIFPITTLIQGIPYAGKVNQIVVFLMLFLMIFTKKKINIKNVIVYFVCIFLSLFSLLFANFDYFRFQDLIYFPFFIVYLLYWSENVKEMESCLIKNIKWCKNCVIMWCILVLVSVIFPSSYSYSWEGQFFMSFTDSPFRLASGCAMIMLLIHICAFYCNKKYFFMELIPLLVVFSTGTRTYLVICIGIFAASVYLFLQKKRMIIVYSIPMIIILFTLIMKSAMADKFKYIVMSNELHYNNIVASVTSGRSIFWAYDLNAYFDLGVLGKLIGNGITFGYQVNHISYGRLIWPHNDFISILMCYGFLGLCLYVYVFTRIAKCFKNFYKINNKICIIAIVLCMANAFINGLYYYSVSTISIPFLFFIMKLDRSVD